MNTVPLHAPHPAEAGHRPDWPRRFWPSMVLLILFVVSQGNLARIIGPLDPSFLEMQFAFSPARYAEILGAWGPEGIERYRSHFAYDLIHPLIFATLGWVTVRTSPVFEGLSLRKERILSWLLPIAAGFDYIENSCQLRLLSVPPGTEDWWIPISATCASLKWALAGLFAVKCAACVVDWCVSQRQNRASV